MGEVYAATDDAGEEAALKILLVDSQADLEAGRRFEQEAAAMMDLASPHVVRMREVSKARAGQPYIAMERLDGSSLAAILRKRRTRQRTLGPRSSMCSTVNRTARRSSSTCQPTSSSSWLSGLPSGRRLDSDAHSTWPTLCEMRRLEGSRRASAGFRCF